MALSDSSVQWRPVILVDEVWFCAIEYQRLSDVEALLWVLGEEVHDKVQHSLAVIIWLVYVCTLLDQRLNQPNLQLNHCQVQRRPKNAAAQIHIDRILFDQNLGSFKVLFAYSKAERRAVVFVQDVWVGLGN